MYFGFGLNFGQTTDFGIAEAKTKYQISVFGLTETEFKSLFSVSVPVNSNPILFALYIEALMGLGDVSEDHIILSDKSDEFLYYIISLFLLTNMTSAPLATPPPRMAEILDLINGRTRELSSKNIYSTPPLRISASKTGSKSEPEPNKKSRTV